MPSREFLIENMTDGRDVLRRICEEKLGGIDLKCEQEEAVISLVPGKDAFAVLPTGFGKSLIYQSYAFARNILDSRLPIILVMGKPSMKFFVPPSPIRISKNFLPPPPPLLAFV